MTLLKKVLLIGGILGLCAMFFFALGNDPRMIPSPLVGKQAPEFTALTLEGEPYSSADQAGKVTLVTFWATWCTTCKADEPLINALRTRYRDNPDFVVIGVVTQDSQSKALDYLQKSKARPYTNLFDERGRLAIDFGVYGVPETYLVDREGNIVRKIAGPINFSVLSKQIDALLNGEAEG
jgi:cytochrome c biogenesis protein CcmG, thiol:disulfide interchange protein DsbE